MAEVVTESAASHYSFKLNETEIYINTRNINLNISREKIINLIGLYKSEFCVSVCLSLCLCVYLNSHRIAKGTSI